MSCGAESFEREKGWGDLTVKDAAGAKSPKYTGLIFTGKSDPGSCYDVCINSWWEGDLWSKKSFLRNTT